jgi:hypothetical protein
MTMSLQKELERRKEEEELAREDEIEFLFPGYRAVDEALDRLKESAQKGFTVGTFDGEDHHRASHVLAHMLADEDTYYHRFSDFLGVFGSRDPELLNSALNFMIRIGVIRLDVSVRDGDEAVSFVVHPGYYPED